MDTYYEGTVQQPSYRRPPVKKSGHFLYSRIIEKGYLEEVTVSLGPVRLTECLTCEEIESGPDAGRAY